MTDLKFEDQFLSFGTIEAVSLSNCQKLVSRRLTKSSADIPKFKASAAALATAR